MKTLNSLVVCVWSALLVCLLVPAAVAQTPEPAQFISFVNGDPRLPGDGVYVERSGELFGVSYFNLSTTIPLSDVTDGLTVTIFPVPPNLYLVGMNISGLPTSACYSHSVAVYETSNFGSITINGVVGVYANVTQTNILNKIAFINQQYTLSCTIEDFEVFGLIVRDIPGTPISLDAAAIGLGSNNYPEVLITPTEAIEALISVVENINSAQGIANSQDVKLKNALDALTAENAGNRLDTIHKLEAFINSVKAQSGKKLTVEQATQLIDGATQVIAGLQ
jgi:hypothetical protein